MIEITLKQLKRVERQLNEAQKRSHFIIFATYDPQANKTVYMITDYQSYQKIKQQRNAQTPMRIARDIVPVTKNLAMWAISENQAAQGNANDYLSEINYYINQVLKDNKLPANF